MHAPQKAARAVEHVNNSVSNYEVAKVYLPALAVLYLARPSKATACTTHKPHTKPSLMATLPRFPRKSAALLAVHACRPERTEAAIRERFSRLKLRAYTGFCPWLCRLRDSNIQSKSHSIPGPVHGIATRPSSVSNWFRGGGLARPRRCPSTRPSRDDSKLTRSELKPSSRSSNEAVLDYRVRMNACARRTGVFWGHRQSCAMPTPSRGSAPR